jgi:ribosomal protein S18 acetylase RimI-like enzyme
MAVAPKAKLRARIVDDRAEIGAFLRRDRLYAAYALGDLEPDNGRMQSVYGLAYGPEGRPVALVMLHEGLIPQPVFLMGDPDGCRLLLADVIRPREALFTARPQLQPAIGANYDLRPGGGMLRMVLDRHTFRPFPGPAVRLGPGDVEALNRLYQLGFRAGFPANVLEEGVYFGVRVRGRLVSAAGTHAINAQEGIAVVGNVMTHVDYRGHDFAKMVTSAVTAELLDRVSDVTLNVHADNVPAVAAYARLGYRTHCEMVECLGRRRAGGWGIMRPIREAMRLTWPQR